MRETARFNARKISRFVCMQFKTQITCNIDVNIALLCQKIIGYRAETNKMQCNAT